MAKKTKAPKSALAQFTPLQIALNSIRHAEKAMEAIEIGIDAAEKALATLRTRQTQVLTSASYVRRLLESEVNGRSPSRRPGEVSLGRKYVDGVMPPRPRSHPSKRRVGSRKRLSPKSSWPKDATHLPH